MHPATRTIKLWRATTVVGACLIVVALVAGYFDVATKFTFEWISNYFNLFLSGLLIGVGLAFVGCIGWANKLESRHRSVMAVVVSSFPWTVLLLGLPFGGTNIHGPAALVMMLILPAAVLSVVLLIMAARRNTTAKTRVISRIVCSAREEQMRAARGDAEATDWAGCRRASKT